MKKYRDVTKEDIGKKCEFWDEYDGDVRGIGVLLDMDRGSFSDSNGIWWDDCRIEVEEVIEEAVKELEPFKVEVPTNMTPEEARQALKKASEDKLEEGWHLVEHTTSKAISVRYLNHQNRWESSIGGHWSDFFKYEAIHRMEAVK